MAEKKLFEAKFSSHWLSTIDTCRHNLRALWTTVDNILQPPVRQLSLLPTTSAPTTSRSASSPRSLKFVRPLPQQPRQSSFQGKWCRRWLNLNRQLLSTLPAKSCTLDPIPQSAKYYGTCATSRCRMEFPQPVKTGSSHTTPQQQLSSIAKMGDRLATIDTAKKWGAAVLFPWGSWVGGSPSNTMSPGRGLYLLINWHLDPSNRLATIHQRHRQDRQTTVR